MRIIYFLVIISTLISTYTNAQQNSNEVNSIMLNEVNEFTIHDIDNAMYEVTQKIKVLNLHDKSNLHFLEFTDKYTKLSDLDITIYDSTGQQEISSYNLKDIHVETNGSGLVEEGKVYYFDLPYQSIPFVYEVHYKLKMKSSLWYPDYYFINPDRQVIHSTYLLHVPPSLDIHYKKYYCDIEPKRTVEKNIINYVWEVNNLNSIHQEQGSAGMQQLLPRIAISPSKFKVGKYEGELDTWQHYGNWYNTLATGQNIIPQELKTQLHKLVDGIPDPKEKAKRIYHYMQENYRYVLITLGMGGFQPISAISTFNTKYGDCKGLSNFMQACLQEVGIKSYQCLINAFYNQQPIDTTFPHHSFNHVILCIPSTRDTTWLECTSKESEFGVLGNFTENRFGLLITEQGGVLVQTPSSKPEQNTTRVKTTISLQSNGEAEVVSNINAYGECKMDFIYHFLESEEKEKKEFLIHEMKLKHPDQVSIQSKREGNEVSTTISANYDDFTEMKTNTKLFVAKNLYGLFKQDLPPAANRKFDFYFESPFISYDTILYHIPVGYHPENLPSNKEFSNSYISYNESVINHIEEGNIELISIFKMKKHIVDAKDYVDFLTLFQEIEEYRGRKLILSK